MTIKIIKKTSFKDKRGLLWTTWKREEFNKINFNHDKFSYKGKYADIDKQETIKWNDPKLNIKWPIKKPILSNRDKNAKAL